MARAQKGMRAPKLEKGWWYLGQWQHWFAERNNLSKRTVEKYWHQGKFKHLDSIRWNGNVVWVREPIQVTAELPLQVRSLTLFPSKA